MSAIAGVFARDGAPPDPATVDRLSAGLAFVGPDDERRCARGPVTMLHRPFHTRPQHPRQRQPLVVDDGAMISFDGRLDATGDQRERGACSEWDDASVVLSAYRRAGVAGLASLVGDFAFALWDPREQRLLLGADALGRRPLYYALTRERLVWSSRARPLAECGMLSCTVDAEYVADFLGSWMPAGSPFTGIRALQGGHVLSVTPHSATTIRYWAPDPTATLSYARDEEYEAHFLELFTAAVAARVATDRPVWCELSGGVDSASIACSADAVLRAQGAAAPPLRTVSYVFDDARSSDERAFIRPIEAQVGREATHLTERECPLLTPLPAGYRPDTPTNGLCFLSRQDRVTHEMAASGSRVLLNGVGGDQLFWSEVPLGLTLADHLVRGELRTLLRECHRISAANRTAFVRTLWKGAVRPVLPRRVQAMTDFGHPLAPWFNREFARRTGFAERVLPMRDDLGFALPSRRMQYGLVRQTMRPFAVEWCSSVAHVELRYPYMDRRLVEFALALPLSQCVRPGQSRSIVRRALRGLVPDPVRLRTSKGGPTEAFHRALATQWPTLEPLFRDPLVAQYGFVDLAPLREALAHARHGRQRSPVQLIRTIALELWLRTLGDGSDAYVGATAPSGRRHTAQGATHARVPQHQL